GRGESRQDLLRSADPVTAPAGHPFTIAVCAGFCRISEARIVTLFSIGRPGRWPGGRRSRCSCRSNRCFMFDHDKKDQRTVCPSRRQPAILGTTGGAAGAVPAGGARGSPRRVPPPPLPPAPTLGGPPTPGPPWP